ncbi:hypothetical protein P154DRAFT_618694 [Amniculicola lignicola CBS 123094]|uniref:Uncharacterized protein n=1 Tax=Amniculicola lignicola CBS 123094 TaxID=1392246 RepID=A0A6A5WN17_9PLEO|nr:hypothetical protein P154DRAFT_618694 [Amniculicola lignicola CBS 123094]
MFKELTGALRRRPLAQPRTSTPSSEKEVYNAEEKEARLEDAEKEVEAELRQTGRVVSSPGWRRRGQEFDGYDYDKEMFYGKGPGEEHGGLKMEPGLSGLFATPLSAQSTTFEQASNNPSEGQTLSSSTKMNTTRPNSISQQRKLPRSDESTQTRKPRSNGHRPTPKSPDVWVILGLAKYPICNDFLYAIGTLTTIESVVREQNITILNPPGYGSRNTDPEIPDICSMVAEWFSRCEIPSTQFKGVFFVSPLPMNNEFVVPMDLVIKIAEGLMHPTPQAYSHEPPKLVIVSSGWGCTIGQRRYREDVWKKLEKPIEHTYWNIDGKRRKQNGTATDEDFVVFAKSAGLHLKCIGKPQVIDKRRRGIDERYAGRPQSRGRERMDFLSQRDWRSESSDTQGYQQRLRYRHLLKRKATPRTWTPGWTRCGPCSKPENKTIGSSTQSLFKC